MIGKNNSISQRSAKLLCLAIAYLLFVWNVYRHWSYLEDDPLIVFRYAINFHAGYGWVMNPGEHVDGCTSWLGLFVVTVLSKFLTIDSAIVVLKIAGIVCGLVTLAKSQEVAEVMLPEAPLLAAFAPLLLAYRSDFAMAAINALETPFAGVFLICGLMAFYRATATKSVGQEWASSLLFALAGLSRPELVVVYPVLKVWQLSKREIVRIAPVAAYAVPFLGVLLFSWVNYHSLLPNTYYAKLVDIPTGMVLGGQYVVYYLMTPMAGPGAVQDAVDVIRCTCSLLCLLAVASRPGRFTEIYLIVVALYVAFLLRTGGDWMVDGRFAMPILPLVAVSWLVGLYVIYSRIGTVGAGRLWTLGLVAGLLTVGMFVDNLHRESAIDQDSESKPFNPSLGGSGPLSGWMCGAPNMRRRLSDWVHDHVRPGQTVALAEVGLVTALNPNVRFIDMQGLNDATIAHFTGYAHRNFGVDTGRDWDNLKSPMGRYLEARAPDYIVTAFGRQGMHSTATYAPNFNYREIDSVVYSISDATYRFDIYERTTVVLDAASAGTK